MQLTPIKTVSSRQNIRFIIVKRSFFRKRYDLPMLLYRKNPPLYTLEMCGKCKLCSRKSRKKDDLQKNIPPIPRKILDLRHKDKEESDAVSSVSANFPKMRQARSIRPLSLDG